MKRHVKIYHEATGHTPGDWIGCEVCGATAVDIHHIRSRGSGGKDTPDNLMALCRSCHQRYGDKDQFRDMLVRAHAKVNKC